jgi:hypothetical protein
MYPLESKFNVDLVSEYSSWNDNMKSEDGLGIPLNDYKFVFNTNQFALEQYFYYRLKHSSYLTNKVEEADLFYIPFFGNLAKMAGQYPVITEFWNHMEENLKKNTSFNTVNLKKHFIVYGGCQKFGNIFMKNYLAKKIPLVVLERNARKKEKSNAIVAPYPALIHFDQAKLQDINFAAKNLLASSVWNSRYPFRWYLAHVICDRSKDCQHVELEPNSDNYNHTYIYELLSRSIFCLNPAGDSPTRKAFWDALLVGCINVLYEKDVKYPFEDKFDYSDMTVYIPSEQMNQTLHILSKIPKERIHHMQQYINSYRRQFQYSSDWRNLEGYGVPFYEKDAFHLILDELYKQSKN